MSEITWTLRVRRYDPSSEEWDGRVWCALVPLFDGGIAFGAISSFDSISFEGEWLTPTRSARFVVREHDGEAAMRLEAVQDSSVRPFAIQEEFDLSEEQRSQLQDAVRGEIQRAAAPLAGDEEESGLLSAMSLALDRLYRSPQELERLREMEEPPGEIALAAASGLVFEARVGEVADTLGPFVVRWTESGQSSEVQVDDVESDLQLGVEGPLGPSTCVAEVQQSAQGFEFRLSSETFRGWSYGRRPEVGGRDAAVSVFDGEHVVVIERWVGAIPSGPSRRMVRRLPDLASLVEGQSDRVFDEIDVVHATDVLAPDELVGQQLHYSIRIQNCHGRDVLVAGASVVRERMGPPAAITAPTFEVSLGTGHEPVAATFSAGLTAVLDDDLEWTSIALYAEDRGLDACGFYGDADDLALFSGLAALDFTGMPSQVPKAGGEDEPHALGVVDEGAGVEQLDAAAVEAFKHEGLEDTDKVGDGEETPRDAGALRAIVGDQTTGRWSTEGLIPLLVYDFSDDDVQGARAEAERESGDGQEVRWTSEIEGESLKSIYPRSGTGRRYHVVRFRRRRAGGRSVRGWRRPSPGDLSLLEVGGGSATVCDHSLRLGQVDERSVFQIERVSPSSGRVFLKRDQFGVALERGGSSPSEDLLPSKLHIRFEHLGKGADEAAPGGYRVWIRDVVGADDGAPFRLAATVQAVPQELASYRPIPLDGTGEWDLEQATLNGRQFETVGKAREGLETLRNHLVRAGLRPDPLMPSIGPPPGLEDEDALALLSKRIGELTDSGQKDARLLETPLEPREGEGADGKGVQWGEFPRFAGTYASGMRDLGLCARFVLPLDRVAEVASGEWTLARAAHAVMLETVSAMQDETAVEGLLGEKGTEQFSLWYAEDDNGHPYATLFLFPHLKAEGDLGEALRFAEMGEDPDGLGPVPGMILRCVRQRGTALTLTRVYDPHDPVVEYTWDGIQDEWRHEVEVAIEVLDRYARFGPSTSGRPNFLQTTGDSWVVQVAHSAPRRHAPIHDRVFVSRDLRSPYRLVFRFIDPPERRAAAANAVNATRLGGHSVAKELRHRLEGRDVYARFIEEEWDTWWDDPDWPQDWLPMPMTRDEELDDPGAQSLLPREEGLDLGKQPPYFVYTYRSELWADGTVGRTSKAEGRVLPESLRMRRPIVGVPKENELDVLDVDDLRRRIDEASLGGGFPETHTPFSGTPPFEDLGYRWGSLQIDHHLARLRDCHSEGWAEPESSPVRLGKHFALDEEKGALPIGVLPDLDLTYRYFLNVGTPNTPSLRLILSMKGRVQVDTSFESEEDDVFQYRTGRWFDRLKVEPSDTSPKHLRQRLTVRLRERDDTWTEAEKAEWQRIHWLLSRPEPSPGDGGVTETKPRPLDVFVQLSRQGRETKPVQI